MREKQVQRYKRFTKRLEATFSSGNLRFRGISSNLSENGLFIRTQHGLKPGSIIDIEIFLPDGLQSRLKGEVMRTVKTSLSTIKNGMGIELIEKDKNYLEFLRNFYAGVDGEQETKVHTPLQSPLNLGGDNTGVTAAGPVPDSLIVTCP